MSNYNSTATATIYVNGQPAQQTIAKLKDDVLGYRKRLQEIAADKSLGVNSKEWNDVRKKIVFFLSQSGCHIQILASLRLSVRT